MAGGIPAGRLNIEIVAEIARLQADLDRAKRAVSAASGDIAKYARAANDNLAAIGKGAGAGVQQFSRDIAALKSQLDPAWAAQQRFNDQQRLGMLAFKQGAIDRQQFIAHMRQISAELKNVQGPARQSSGSMRQFTLQMSQVGQQVMAGTSLIQAFAMQLPDIAAGMNGASGSAGKFATFLGGPWGIALTSAIALAVSFGMELLTVDDNTTKAQRTQRSFVQVLNDSKSSWAEMTKAAKDYADQQKKNRETTLQTIKSEFAAATANRETALSIRQKLAADLEYYEMLTRRGAQSEAGEVARQGAFARADILREKIAQNAAAIKAQNAAAIEAGIKYATALAEINVDPGARIRAQYDELEQQAKNKFKSVGELTKALTQLGKAEQEALARLSESNRKHASDTVKLAKVTGEEIARALGTTINSGVRSAAKNKDVGGGKNSYHLIGQAIDIPLTANGKPLTKAGIRAVLEPLGIQIKELLGPGDKGHKDHFHIAFGIKRLAPDQVAKLQEDAADAAREAAEKARMQLEKFRFDILQTSYEMEGLLTKALLPGLLAAEQKVWDEFVARVRKAGDAGVEGAHAASQAYASLNDELRKTVDLLDDIGTSGRGLGDIAAAMLGLTSGDWSGARGPLGSLLRTFGEITWRDPADAEGPGQIRILREEIVTALDKVFGGRGSFSKTMTGLLRSAGTGMAAGSLLFGKQSQNEQIGSAIGGALGGKIGEKALSKGFEGIAKGLGEFAGPIGAVMGGVLGSVLGGLFTKAKWGRVDVSSSGVSATRGNSGSSEKAALASGNSILSGLKDLATQLGGTLGDFGSIAVGIRNGDYRVNTKGTSLKIKKGAVNFEDDAQAAVAFAMKEAIERGALTGIRNSTNSLLKAGEDLGVQLQKALNFEGVFAELKGYTDPVGAALDEVNKQFDQLRVIFREAGATAEEYAQLEQLLTIKRQEALSKEADALADIRSRIAEAQGDDATVKQIARAKELKDALNDNVRAELQRLYAIEDATQAQGEAAAAAEQLRQTWKTLGGSIMDEVRRIRGLAGGDEKAGFAALMGQFNVATAAARGGDQEAAARLVELSQSLIEAAGNTATSRQELERVKMQTAASLEATHAAIQAMAGLQSPPSVSTPANDAPQAAATAAQASADLLVGEVRDLREEVARLRKENSAGHAATASAAGRSARVLESVSSSSGGDALAVANGA